VASGGSGGGTVTAACVDLEPALARGMGSSVSG